MTCVCGNTWLDHAHGNPVGCTGYRPRHTSPIDLPAAIRAERIRRDTGRGIQGELASAPTSVLEWLEEWARQQEKP